jgi:hypothetical protein
MLSLFCDQCHVYISNFTESAVGLILRFSTWKMIRYRQDKFLGKGRQCILISHYFIQGQMETNVYFLLAPKAQYLICSYKDCEGQYVANLLTGIFQH